MQRSINNKDSSYPFENLLEDIKANKVGTALYVSNLSEEQCEMLMSILRAGQHGLTQISFLNCKTKDLTKFPSMHSLQMTYGWGDSCKVATIYCQNIWAKSINTRIETDVNINAHFNTIKTLWCTPLYIAVMRNDVEKVASLLAQGANPNITSQYNKEDSFFKDSPFKDVYRCPLQVAVDNNNPDIVKLLLTYGADPTITEFMDSCATELACDKPDILKVFARAGCLLNCRLKWSNEELLQHLAKVSFPILKISYGMSNEEQYTRENFPLAANSTEEFVQMLTTYDEAERKLLAKVCHYALLRCEKNDPMRKCYFNLISLCTGVPSLKSLATIECVKLDNGGLCRNLPSAQEHQEITIYGDEFQLAKLPQDLITEIIQENEMLEKSSMSFGFM